MSKTVVEDLWRDCRAMGDCVAQVVAYNGQDEAIAVAVVTTGENCQQVLDAVRPLTAEGEDGPPFSVFQAGPELLVACETVLALVQECKSACKPLPFPDVEKALSPAVAKACALAAGGAAEEGRG